MCVTVQRYAQDVVALKVREMDEQERMDPEIIKACFEQGVRKFSLHAAFLADGTVAHGHRVERGPRRRGELVHRGYHCD